ncbi:MAG: hypothetical protein QF415_14620, partial [Candidatus Undinarchaeales archaeon]|nr:hypothetical protein [Candidatus Undinarchaeales archaeon]
CDTECITHLDCGPDLLCSEDWTCVEEACGLDPFEPNDAVEQAKTFKEKVGIDGIVLTKVDVDAKGGSSLSISYVTRSPIVFIGTGQEYEDLESFDPQWFIEQITSTTQEEEEE